MPEVQRREWFFQNVREAFSETQKPVIVTSGAQIMSGSALDSVVRRSVDWLNPKLVNAYDPAEFRDASEPDQAELRQRMEEFRTLADAVSLQNGPSYLQSEKGFKLLDGLFAVVKRIVLREWSTAATWLIDEIKDACNNKGLKYRRKDKILSESLLGEYSVPQILIEAKEPVDIAPIARFIVGGAGLYDMTLLYSGYTATIFRNHDRVWQIQLDVGEGVERGRAVAFTKESFILVLKELVEMSDAYTQNAGRQNGEN